MEIEMRALTALDEDAFSAANPMRAGLLASSAPASASREARDAAHAASDRHALALPCFRRRVVLPRGLHRSSLFVAHALNLAFMLLYTLLDFLRAWDARNPLLVSAGLVVLGWGYVLDAALYCVSWVPVRPFGVALWGEVLNVLGSLMYGVTSVLYIYESESSLDADVVYVMEATCTLLFLVDAALYFVAWYEAPAPKLRGKGCDWRDLDLWANLLNVAAAVIYVVAAANGLLLHFTTGGALLDSPGAPPQPLPSPLPSPSPLLVPLLTSGSGYGVGGSGGLEIEWKPGRSALVLRDMARVYVYGDIVWTVDAVVYLLAWAREEVAWEEAQEADEEAEAERAMGKEGGAWARKGWGGEEAGCESESDSGALAVVEPKGALQ